VESLSLADHGRAEIDANAIGRFQPRQDLTRATAEFEHTESLRDEETQISKVLLVEETGTCTLRVSLGRGPIGIGENFGFAR
jgi:hypothetical protein